jgi:hypothetical protein
MATGARILGAGSGTEVRFAITRSSAKTIGERLRRLLFACHRFRLVMPGERGGRADTGQHVSGFSLDEGTLELPHVVL